VEKIFDKHPHSCPKDLIIQRKWKKEKALNHSSSKKSMIGRPLSMDFMEAFRDMEIFFMKKSESDLSSKG
jgi:hypothetical protein